MLGADKDLVAVSKYCDYPAQAKQKDNIGGFLDFSREKILLLQPDYVFVLKNNDVLRRFLGDNHLKAKVYDNESLEGLYDMIQDIGQLTGKSEKAIQLTGLLSGEVSKRQNKYKNDRKVKALVVFEQVIKSDKVQGLYIMGQDKFYGKLLSAVGFANVYTGKMKYPLISPEAIIEMNPEAIIVLEAGKAEDYKDLKIKAVKDNKVFFLADNYYKRPGPRFNLILGGLEKVRSSLTPQQAQ